MAHEQEAILPKPAPTASDTPFAHRRDNVFEDVHIDEGVFQFIGSTSSHTTTAKSISVKPGSTQFLGDLSDTTVQKVSSDRRVTAQNNTRPESSTTKFAVHGRGQVLGAGIDGEKDISR
ncbi:hypothetical protein ASPCAL10852 [Aspergillus calidoustus]|uniref:Uncharacterized protein n=1 Tax=Aspergillus calidoustus TaxID=454130 RepID=A0A0U5G7N0_ASPCI|nr:hypothetical protein ASPCAL10852 [Aspergillus calidoustus]